MQISGVGQAAIQAEEVEYINADSSTTVKAGNSEVVNIKAPTGYIYEILNLELEVLRPTGSTSGLHRFVVLSETEDINITAGVSNFDDTIAFTHNYWSTATSFQRPTTEVGQVLSIRNQRVDDDDGLDIQYTNDTDKDQTHTRTIRLAVRKIKVAT